ncbi:MAG TPA: methylmalonyl Co-A mutase-associated GTPase MeaB [Balneola sp.]|jgi:LAO/AO transport system kinase|nr:methylmalonyl Co-A mutase-associated GTPase MeaB [Balneola sp.]MAO77256.1 methylmalonyl Co-A mutase-associated GTPase MeaB [Balneola sp.]MBF63030.1 methylmalonyl Co-A mutase-associated GTPase MeaB [Balneola sp.]HBZ39217.1 methylmalonyl Co-A mutase-associated GTPase MeaB [Balneola sp.]|tara:strand:+ start:56399 stop:57361 length:963 start_codon:yes stop_codon:yes gene_type:complete
MTIDELAKGVQEGKRRHLAKAITLVESNREADQQTAQELISKVRSAKETVRVGISGVPGVGKSTFIEALGNLLIEEGLKVAVLAVDPSSPATGGSILGDKTRMETLSSKDEAFIRPSPTSGTLGGVAKRTRESMMLCEAAGYDVILVETVGVGQSEFEVASMVDCFLVLMLPGAGDSLQGIKRGIMEIIDILVINKADGDQEKMAKNAVMEYQNAFHLLTPKYDGIGVEFLTVSSIKKKRIDEAWEKIQGFISALKEKEIFEAQRKEQELNWFKRLVEDEVLRRLWNSRENKKSVEDLISRIKSGKITPSKAAMELLSKI